MAEIDIKKQIENYTKLNKRLAQYSTEIQRIFEMLNVEGCQLALSTTPILKHLDKIFRFADYPQTKAGVDKLLKKYTKELQTLIISGMEAEYTKGDETQTILGENIVNRCNSALPEDKQIPLDKAKLGIVTSSTDLAVKSFTEKRLKNFNLRSVLALQSVKYKDELECAISTALTKGTSARELAKQVTTLFRDHAKFEAQYLEKFGKKLNTGKTLYEAMRLARTEINMAYRDAEQSRWGDMPFILGYEIRLSNNHNCKGIPKGKFYDICDELEGKYPKDFKWLGWHPNCYHKDTKILTNNGWKYFYDVLDTDLICSLNPETKKNEWVHFIARQKYWYEGDMVHFYNKSLECLVTPEHSMVYLDAKGDICRREASEFTYNDGSFILGLYTKCSTNYFSKEIVPYNDFVYDLTLEKNHIFYVSLNGKCFWGSNCRCKAIPILMSDEQFIQWNNGKQVNAPTIDKMPEKFDNWLEHNKERIERATQRGTLPYFLRDNGTIKGGKFVFSLPIKDKPLTILEKAEIRHKNRTSAQIKEIQDRWNKRRKENALINKTADNLLNVAKNYPEVDITPITQSKYFKQSDRIFANKTVAQEILKIKKDETFLSNLIPDVHDWKKQFSSTELHNVYNAVESKLKQWNNLSLQDKLKKLDFEIKYLANPSYYKPGAKQYSTWKVAQSAYTKQLSEVTYTIDIKSVQNNLSVVKQWSLQHPNSHKVANLLKEVDELISSKSNIVAIQEKAQLAYKTYNERLKEQAYRDKLRGKTVTSNKPFSADAYTKERKDAAIWAKNTKEADDVLRDKCGEVWRSISSNEKDAIHGYTNSYHNINEPLRGIQYIGSKEKIQEGLDRIPLIEKVIDKSYYDFDIWLQRGDGMISLKKFGLSNYGYASDDEIFNLVGKEGVEGAFWSAGVAKGKGMSGSIIFNIYAPKGTKMMYCEPFSSYGYGDGRVWNGIDKQFSFGKESEILIQRGTKYRITKVDKSSGQWYIDVEVIAQDLVPFPYTDGHPFL